MNWGAFLVTLGVLTLTGGAVGVVHQTVDGERVTRLPWSLLLIGTVCLAVGAGLTQ